MSKRRDHDVLITRLITAVAMLPLRTLHDGWNMSAVEAALRSRENTPRLFDLREDDDGQPRLEHVSPCVATGHHKGTF